MHESGKVPVVSHANHRFDEQQEARRGGQQGEGGSFQAIGHEAAQLVAESLLPQAGEALAHSRTEASLSANLSRVKPGWVAAVTAVDGRTAASVARSRSRRDRGVCLREYDPVAPQRKARPRPIPPSASVAAVARIVSFLRSPPGLAAVDQALRLAVEVARSVLGLERAALFVFDAAADRLLGTWGTDAIGATVDQHAMVLPADGICRHAFARAAQGYPWSAYEGRLAREHCLEQARGGGRAWLALTPVLGGSGPVAMLFNDTALSGGAFDESKQSGAAVLASMLGRALEPHVEALVGARADRDRRQQHWVFRAGELLVQDPSISLPDLARRYRVTTWHLSRMFKRYHGTTVVTYRNRVRLTRLLAQMRDDATGLSQAAVAAGFGSYTQFHRVFREHFGATPRVYFRDRRQASSHTGWATGHEARA